MKDSVIYLKNSIELNIEIPETPTTECLKISFLRKKYDNDIDLEKWMNINNNLYVGRMGRIFITNKQKEKKVFHYKSSKWANPYKVGLKDYTLEESLKLYEKYIIDNNLIKDLQELNGKNLGCFCDQNNNCHAKVLAELFKINVKN